MPGATVVVNPPEPDLLHHSLACACVMDTYEYEIVRQDGAGVIAWSGYSEYPVETYEIDGWTVLLEGYIYDVTDRRSAIGEITTWLANGDSDRLAEWLGGRDGDFLIIAVEPSGREIWAINDAFARLPTYLASIGETTVLSRELSIIRRLARELDDGLASDRMGLGQTLLFGHPLGTRTIFEDVAQLPPGSLYNASSEEITALYEFRTDQQEPEVRDVSANARTLRDRFLEACANRAAVADPAIVSLSGGLDSRAVVAGFAHVDDNVRAATSLRADDGNAEEVAVARRVANVLDVPWGSYTADWTDRHERLLLETAQGMNNLGMSLGLDFAEQLASDYEGAMVLTGDGGDKALPDLEPNQRLSSDAELVDHLVETNHVFAIDQVSDLVEISPAALRASVEQRIAAYPETDIGAKHAHFLVRERGINWLNHGEDRTRYYVWSTSPFYSLPFFNAAMRCPPSQKRGSRLYRSFLAELSQEAVEIEYVDFGASIDSFEYRIKRYAYDWLSDRPRVKAHVSQFLGGGGTTANGFPTEKLLEASESVSIEQALSVDRIKQVAAEADSYSRKQLYILFTLTSAIGYEERVSQAR